MSCMATQTVSRTASCASSIGEASTADGCATSLSQLPLPGPLNNAAAASPLQRANSHSGSEHLLGLMSESLAIFEEALAHGGLPDATGGGGSSGRGTGGGSSGGGGGLHGNTIHGSLHGSNRAAGALKAAGGAGGLFTETDAAVVAASAALHQHQQSGAAGKAAAAAGLLGVHGHHSPHHLHHHQHHQYGGHSNRSSLERSRHGAATPIQEREREGEDSDGDGGDTSGSKPQQQTSVTSVIGGGRLAGERVHGGHISTSPPGRASLLANSPPSHRRAAAATVSAFNAATGQAVPRNGTSSSGAANTSSAPPPAVLRLPPPDPQGPFCVLASAAVPPPPSADITAPGMASASFLTAPTSPASHQFPGLMSQQFGGSNRGSATNIASSPTVARAGSTGPNFGIGWGLGLGVSASPGGGLVDVGLRPACLSEGWDVVAPHELAGVLPPDAWAKLIGGCWGWWSSRGRGALVGVWVVWGLRCLLSLPLMLSPTVTLCQFQAAASLTCLALPASDRLSCTVLKQAACCQCKHALQKCCCALCFLYYMLLPLLPRPTRVCCVPPTLPQTPSSATARPSPSCVVVCCRRWTGRVGRWGGGGSGRVGLWLCTARVPLSMNVAYIVRAVWRDCNVMPPLLPVAVLLLLPLCIIRLHACCWFACMKLRRTIAQQSHCTTVSLAQGGPVPCRSPC